MVYRGSPRNTKLHLRHGGSITCDICDLNNVLNFSFLFSLTQISNQFLIFPTKSHLEDIISRPHYHCVQPWWGFCRPWTFQTSRPFVNTKQTVRLARSIDIFNPQTQRHSIQDGFHLVVIRPLYQTFPRLFPLLRPTSQTQRRLQLKPESCLVRI